MSLALIRANAAVELNPVQQRAVEHGLGEPGGPSALLVIAGAGSGKTAMLAHRVAALILAGADPKRIMLATFSRRAAAELNRRVERIVARRLPAEAAAAPVPAWSGTFHAIGARLLREYVERVGLDPQFTIHDREDSADLMNWARHEAGLSETRERFPTKGTCLAIYSRVVNARGDLASTLGKWFPFAAAHEAALRGLFAAYVEAKQRQNVLDYDDLLLYFAQMLEEPTTAGEIAARFDHLLIDEYQDTNALQGEIALKLRPRGQGSDRRRRRCTGDLFLPRGDGAQHPRLSRELRSARSSRRARTQLPLDRSHSRRRQCGDRARARALRQDALDRSRVRRAARARHAQGRSRAGALRRVLGPRQPRGGRDAQIAGRALPHVAP
jgi:superfamily I DNA/RNA helicase